MQEFFPTDAKKNDIFFSIVESLAQFIFPPIR